MLKTILKNYRNEIDNIDKMIVELFIERMQISKDIAEVKRLLDAPILDSKRELQVILHVQSYANDEYKQDVFDLYSLIMEMSKKHQRKHI